MRFCRISINSNLMILLSLAVITGGCRQAPVTEQPSQIQTVKSEISAECIVGYFRKDNAPYFTQQQHHFNPLAGYLKVIALEPTGIYTFTLMNDQFKGAKQKTQFLSDLPASFFNQPLATALFYSFTAGSGLLDTAQFIPAENVKIEGQWYQPLTPTNFSSRSDAIICLLKNINTNRIELVELSDTQMIDDDPELESIVCLNIEQKKWLLRNYNLRYIKDLNTLVPMKIDVFDIQNGIASKRLIIQFEYKSILKN